jgi:hypothetical protein
MIAATGVRIDHGNCLITVVEIELTTIGKHLGLIGC